VSQDTKNQLPKHHSWCLQTPKSVAETPKKGETQLPPLLVFRDTTDSVSCLVFRNTKSGGSWFSPFFGVSRHFFCSVGREAKEEKKNEKYES
jgi:hypothetical protein